jgi:hypothetical protein
MKSKTYSTDIDLGELTGKIAQVRGGLDFMTNNLGGLCSEEQAHATLAQANRRLKKVQETLYDVMYTDK